MPTVNEMGGWKDKNGNSEIKQSMEQVSKWTTVWKNWLRTPILQLAWKTQFYFINLWCWSWRIFAEDLAS